MLSRVPARPAPGSEMGYRTEVGALFSTVSSIRVSRISRVRVTLTVTVRVSRVSVMGHAKLRR